MPDRKHLDEPTAENITGRPQLNREERKARAQVVLARRLARVPVADVMAELGMTIHEYKTSLTLAHKLGLTDQARDFLLVDLLPRALRVYANALDAGDTEVARDVLRGAGIISNGSSITVETGDGAGVTLTYERWRAERALDAAGDQAGAKAPSGSVDGSGEGIIDAEAETEGRPDGREAGLPLKRLSDHVEERGNRPSPRPFLKEEPS